ncbi:MAG TPA: FHA domain-containing protein, partial [Polyangiaceae bacterium]|nr:FHA domain-containing protein [Polyangiaceae bacterium]
MSRTALSFAVYRQELPSHQVTTRTDVVKIGRGPGAHLEIAEGERMHAVIEVAGPETITLVDLGHAAGTRVNGVAVTKCRLAVGDRIQIGDTTLVLEQAALATDAPTAPAPRADAAVGPGVPLFAVAAAPRVGAPNPFAAAGPVGLHNPFAAALARDDTRFAVAEDAAPGTYTYAMVQRGPAVSAAEVELPDQEATEVMILWGQDVLHVTHLRPGQPFCVG